MFHTVGAFLDAFTADDPVVLVVKSGPKIEMPPDPAWGSDHPYSWTTGWQMARLVSRYRNPARVRLEVGTWTPEQIAGLHHRGDCYVSLPRGEGWGLGAFDACAYGNPVVATGWGAFLEFLKPENAYLVDYSLSAVEHNAYASYSPDQRWAEPDRDHAVSFLRAIASDLPAARARAAIAQERVLRDYAPSIVARRFRDALGKLG